ncbi:hypothetical protein LguiA_000817 [Lonicera macranthoides]
MPSTATARINLTTSNLLPTLLSFLSNQKCPTSFNFNYLKKIHSLLITCNLSNCTFLLTNLLLHSYPPTSHANHFDLAYTSSLINQIGRPNTYLWNSMIQMFSSSSEPQMSLIFFARMRQDGVFPNKHTFPLLLKAFSRAKDENPFQVYAQIVKFGFNSDHFVQNSLVSAFANYGDIECAHQMFDEITLKDLITWTAMINGYLKIGHGMGALEVFVEMRSKGVKVDEVTIVSVLGGAGMVGDIWFGRWVHGFYVESGRVHWDVYVGSALVDMYSKCGNCDDARKVFEEMPCRNIVSWSALIAGCVQCYRFKDALLVFCDMLAEAVEPNQTTLTSVLTACAQLGALDQGRWVHKYIGTSKLKMNPTVGTALVDMYAKCGCIRLAFLVFENLPIKDVYIWTAMINGLAIHGDAANSLNLFSQMLSSDVRPNEVTLIGVLSACSHGGLVDEGRKLFGSMKHIYGLEPNVDHYGCMVDLLGRAGYLDEAVKLIENMPMEPTPGVWGALFGACMNHKAYELGEWVGKHLIKLQPHHSGRYALLANLYSKRCNWEAAAHIRKLMKESGLEKNPGCSWVELNGVVHEFFAFDELHRDSKSVYTILETIVVHSECANCISDMELFLHDIH